MAYLPPSNDLARELEMRRAFFPPTPPSGGGGITMTPVRGECSHRYVFLRTEPFCETSLECSANDAIPATADAAMDVFYCERCLQYRYVELVGGSSNG